MKSSQTLNARRAADWPRLLVKPGDNLWRAFAESIAVASGAPSRADAIGLASFQYDGLRGLVRQVDAGGISVEEAIHLFIEVLTGAVERLSVKSRRPVPARSRRWRA